MPPPTLPEAVADVRRLYGQQTLLRLVWSGDASVVFEVLTAAGVEAFLKVGKDLAPERDRLQWLEGKLPVPSVVCFGSTDDTSWLVVTPMIGLDLTNLKHTEPPHRIAAWLADALQIVHAVRSDDCPFGVRAEDAVLTHGDACLPNFLFSRGRLTGVVDVGSCGLGHPAVDLALGVWSLQYNLGPGHGREFLDAYGADLAELRVTLVKDKDGQESLERL